MELSKRTRDIPFLSAGPPEERAKVNWKEYSARAYTYWIPVSNVTASATYQFDKKDNGDNSLGEFASKIRIHRLPLKLNYFHPNGFSAGLTATYVDENGVFQNPASATDFFTDGDNFWVLDAFISYRLPKHYGIVSFNIDNLLNEKFRFQDIDPESIELKPERIAFFKFTLSF